MPRRVRDIRESLQASLGDAYRIERELTRGSMSRAFAAHETALGRTVVRKVLSPELAATLFAERSKREISLAAHAHQVPEAVAKRRADTPASLVRPVMTCLEKAPAARPQHASEIVAALKDPRGSGSTATARPSLQAVLPWAIAAVATAAATYFATRR